MSEKEKTAYGAIKNDPDVAYVAFRNYDGAVRTLKFRTDDDDDGFITFQRGKNAVSRLIITRYAIPAHGPNPAQLGFYEVICEDNGLMPEGQPRLDGHVRFKTDDELCCWIRSFLYMHGAKMLATER